MKALICHNTILIYPDPNKPFIIDTEASNYQLGGVIKQQLHCSSKPYPAAFYSCKLNLAQMNYTTIEKELLSIVEI